MTSPLSSNFARNLDHGTVDRAGSIGAKEEDEVGNFLRVDPLRVILTRGGTDVCFHRKYTGCDDIHGDTTPLHLIGKDLGENDNASFGDRICTQAGHCRYVDNPSAAILRHDFKSAARAEEH